MLPSWLKTVLIVGGIVAVVGAVVFLWLLVKGADMRRRNQAPYEENSDGGKVSQINDDKRDPL